MFIFPIINVPLSETGLAPSVIFLNSTTSWFSVFWSNPTPDFMLVSGYEVTWRVASSSAISSGLLSRTKNQYTSPSNLTSGQLYLVNVNSHADLTEPTQSIVVTSGDRNMRTGAKYYMTLFRYRLSLVTN